MLADGPALGNFHGKPLECQGPRVRILAHLDIALPIQKIVWLSLFDKTLSLDFSSKCT